jgi:hypothetical protein
MSFSAWTSKEADAVPALQDIVRVMMLQADAHRGWQGRARGTLAG